MNIGKIPPFLILLVIVAGVVPQARAQSIQEMGQDFFEVNDVCKRHRAELMKIAHVRIVTAEIDARKDAVILVEVDNPEKVEEVTRKLPPRIEGFPVEVGADDSSELAPAHYLHRAPRSQLEDEPAPAATIDPSH